MDDTQASMSRRERRELQRTQQRSGQTQSRGMRRFLIWGGGLALLVGFGWLMVHMANNVKLPSDEGTLTVPVSETDNSTGPASASLTLLEYSDFQCPACGAFYPIVKQLLADPELAGKLRFVYRNFPLTNIHPNAQLAAQAGAAAAVQGKFWEMHDMLFENQDKWSGMSSDGARAEFMKYALALSINTEWFAGDIDSDDVKKKVADDRQGGIAAGVSSTPTFFLNGSKMPHPNSYAAFKQAIVDKLNPAASVAPTASITPNATP